MVPFKLKVVVLSLGILLIFLIGLNSPGPRRSKTYIDWVVALDAQLAVDEVVPFTLRDVNGSLHQWSHYKGSVVVLNFWASYCAPCKKEFPSFIRMASRFTGSGLKVIAISNDQSMDDLSAFLDSQFQGVKPPFTIMLDPEGEVSAKYGTQMLPETYIIGKDGTVRVRLVGPYDWERPEITRLLTVLLGE